jgi:hypothetical protein
VHGPLRWSRAQPFTSSAPRASPSRTSAALGATPLRAPISEDEARAELQQLVGPRLVAELPGRIPSRRLEARPRMVLAVAHRRRGSRSQESLPLAASALRGHPVTEEDGTLPETLARQHSLRSRVRASTGSGWKIAAPRTTRLQIARSDPAEPVPIAGFPRCRVAKWRVRSRSCYRGGRRLPTTGSSPLGRRPPRPRVIAGRLGQRDARKPA